MLTVDNFKLTYEGILLGTIISHSGGLCLVTRATQREFVSAAEFEADMARNPDVALRHAEVSIAEAHFAANEAASAARRGDRASVRAALSRCDAQIALSKAWRALACIEVEP